MEMEISTFKALRMMSRVNAALENDDYAELALALGMTPEMIEQMSIVEVFEAMTVRMSDLTKAIDKGLNK